MIHRARRVLIIVLVPLLCGSSALVGAQSPPSGGATERTIDRVDVLGALTDSLTLLMIEHPTRLAFQPKTRDALGGPFWRDYPHSIRWPAQWEDTDSWLVNYIGHPIHGAAAGIIWLEHGQQRDVPLNSRRYWASLGKAAAYTAGYSLQFEIGPLSEASIGNVLLNCGCTIDSSAQRFS